VRGQPVGAFLVLTFGVTWALWGLVFQGLGAESDVSHASRLLSLGGPVFLLGVFAPGLIALALTAWYDGGSAAGTLLRRVTRWRVGLRFYSFALLLMPLTKLTVAVVYRVLTGRWPMFGESRPLLLAIATILSTLGQAGEEIGWRGYLLPKLTERAGLAGASLLVGGIWAVWHLPLFFARGADTYRQSFPLYALQLTAYSVTLAWLYWRTQGSLLLTMFMHAALNNTKDIVPSAGTPGPTAFTFDSTLVFRLSVLLLWVIAALLLVSMRRARLTQSDTRAAHPRRPTSTASRH
jgi:uncharacterized protein